MKRILVVEDVEELRAQLINAVEGEGREVVEAASAKEAIELIQANNFDAVVTDLKMETDTVGLEVLKAAKSKDIYTQVLMITAYGTPKISVKAMGLGAFDYLERNTPGTDTLSMVRSKIDLALEFREAKLKEERQ